MAKLTVGHGYDGYCILDSFKKTEEEKTAQLNIKTQTKVYANSSQHQELYWEAKLRQILTYLKKGRVFTHPGLLGVAGQNFISLLSLEISVTYVTYCTYAALWLKLKMLITGSEVNAAISSFYPKVLLFNYLAFF